MEQKNKRPVSVKEAQYYAKTVLEREWSCAVKELRFIGGGSFGFVYSATIDRSPTTVIMKGFRCGELCGREASELQMLARNSVIKVPKVYFTFFETTEIPMDFLCMEKNIHQNKTLIRREERE